MNFRLFVSCICIWMSVCLSVYSQHELQFFQQYNESRVYHKPDSLLVKSWNTNPGEDASLSIDLIDTVAPVLSTQFGVNTPFRNGNRMATDGIRLPMYRSARLNSYRYPAGSGSNHYFWDGNIPASFQIPDVSPIDGQQNSILDSELFAGFLDSVQAEGTIVINYFYARYGITTSGSRADRVSQAAAYAADWVRYMNTTLGAHIKHWEIGNECYGSWETGYDVNGSIVTGQEYGEDFRVFVDSMKAVDPTIKVGAVVHRQNQNWNSGVLPEVQDHADFLVVHNYFTGFTPTASEILSSVPEVAEVANRLRNHVQSYTNKARDHFPLAFTEFNSRGTHTLTINNGLFVTQVLGELIEHRYGMSCLWVSEWRLQDNGNWSHGFLAWDDPDQADYTARPSYMPFHFYGKCFGDQMLASQISGDQDIKAYASRFSSGELGLVIVNQSSTDKEVALSVDSTSIWKSVDWYEVYASDRNVGNKRFFINGQTSTTAGGGPENFDQIPPYHTGFDPGKTFTAKAWSANFLVIRVDSTSITAVDPVEDKRLLVYPNPTKDLLRIDYPFPLEAIEVWDKAGKLKRRMEGNGSSVDVSALSRGQYFLTIYSKGEKVSTSFVIE
ncbi:MAG: T9SS type A sorting domain-containing protein [Bacteroidota bacterium]